VAAALKPKRTPRAPKPPKLPPRAWRSAPPVAAPAVAAPAVATSATPSQRRSRRVCVYLTAASAAALEGVKGFLEKQSGATAGSSAAVSYALRFAVGTLKAAGVVSEGAATD